MNVTFCYARELAIPHTFSNPCSCIPKQTRYESYEINRSALFSRFKTTVQQRSPNIDVSAHILQEIVENVWFQCSAGRFECKQMVVVDERETRMECEMRNCIASVK
ncbi:hypothetical protein CRM22_011176 [Opisthorchis felineus]|uniref:Uncharacterized protein n=1 Tax=Opisthorchis felineus TaxID=147828 RepID=A0A4S2K618_OPIFE|nr:hypothetical protein CRM22_011176 [Opisthorchis felineus]